MMVVLFLLGLSGLLFRCFSRHSIDLYTRYPLMCGLAVLSFRSAASRAAVTDYTCVSALRVSVNRMVDRTVAYADLFHVSYDLLKGTKVAQRIAVKLNITDMTCVGQFVIRRFDSQLFKSVDLLIYRYMEGLCIVLSVRNARNVPEKFLVHLYKTSRKTLGRCSQQ